MEKTTSLKIKQNIEKPKSMLKKNVSFQYALQIAKYLFPFITLPYLTRVLGPDVYAVRAYILAAMVFMQTFLDFGFNTYGTKAIAENSDSHNYIQLETSSIAFLRAILCAVGALLLITITPFIPIMAANPLYVALAYLGICFKATLPDFIFQGLEDMGIITKRFVVSQTIATIFIFIMVHGSEDLLWVPVLEGLASLIAFAWSWENVIRVRRIVFTKVKKEKLWSVFKGSLVFFVSNASTTLFTALTTLMVGILIVDPTEISYWSLAMMTISAIQSLYTPITNSLFPHMVRQRDFAMLKRLLFIGMIVVTIGTIAFLCLSNVIMLVLGGSEYLDGSYVIALVSPVLWFSYPAVLLGFPVLAAVGRIKQLTTSSVVSALFHIVGLFVLAGGGWFTIANVAILRCCTEGVLCFIRVAFVMKYKKDKYEVEG